MDAGAMTRLAKDWELVPEQKTCIAEPANFVQLSIKGGTIQEVSFDASNCGSINFLEHIHLNIDLTSGAARGDLSVEIKSPGGTNSILLAPRPFDQIRTGFGLFKTWPMMSVHFWGESVINPNDQSGLWTLKITNNGDKPCVLNNWNMVFYGTETDPQPGVDIRPVFDDDAEIFYDEPEESETEETSPIPVTETEIEEEKPEKLEILNDRE